MYGEYIRNVREQKGLSQKELAFKTNIPLEKIINYEDNLSEPTTSQLVEIAKALETSIDILLGYKLWEYDEEFNDFMNYLLSDDEDDDSDEGCEELDEECDECDSFAECMVRPHMETFLDNNEEAAYIHLEIGGEHISTLVGGRGGELTAGINLIIEEMCKQSGQDYYDFLKTMAEVRTRCVLDKKKE